MIDNRYDADLPKLDENQPDPRDVELERLRKEAADRDIQIAEQRARFDQMEKDVSRRFAENKQTAPATDDMYAAQQELEIKDEELLDPATAPGAIRKIAEHQAKKMVSERDQVYGGAIGNLAESVFDVQMDRMQGHEFFGDLEPLIRDYFDDNPSELHIKGKIEEVYERLVGKNYEILKGKKQEESNELNKNSGRDVSAAKTRYRQQSRVVDAPVQTASPSARPDTQKKEVVLDEAREQERLRFQGLGVDISPEEWQDIETGKKYPKKFAADIQVGLSRPNVDYES